jgi:hypothetical protein
MLGVRGGDGGGRDRENVYCGATDMILENSAAFQFNVGGGSAGQPALTTVKFVDGSDTNRARGTFYWTVDFPTNGMGAGTVLTSATVMTRGGDTTYTPPGTANTMANPDVKLTASPLVASTYQGKLIPFVITRFASSDTSTGDGLVGGIYFKRVT